MSLYDTTQHGSYAYFDASISLLFFLLIGRTLDYMMRERARSAVRRIGATGGAWCARVQADGRQVHLPVSEIQAGMTIMLAACERVPVDATVTKGTSELDASLVSGEQTPVPATVGSPLRGGHLESDRATVDPRHGDTGQFVSGRDGTHDGGRRAGPSAGISPHRRSCRQPSMRRSSILTACAALVGWLLATV
jgi:Cu2+-exporting ATPase